MPLRTPSSPRAALAAVLLFLPVAALRAEPAPTPDWNARFRSASEALHAGEWERGRAEIDALLREMRETISSGEGAAASLGVATMYRAVAEAGLGDREGAAWDLSMAIALLPSLAEADLNGFGVAGERLAAERSAADDAARDLSGVARPERLSGDVPTFPFGKAQVCRAEAVKVRMVVGADGVPRRPRVATGTDPVLAWAAMEALRGWRYRPAMRGSQPLAVPFAVTVDYRVLNCPPPAPAPPAPD